MLVKSYASTIYLAGRNSFPNLALIGKSDYVEPVKQYAAANYSTSLIDYARDQGYITPQEHADTIALKTPNDPQ